MASPDGNITTQIPRVLEKVCSLYSTELSPFEKVLLGWALAETVHLTMEHEVILQPKQPLTSWDLSDLPCHEVRWA